MHSVFLLIIGSVGEIDSRNPSMLPTLAEGVLVVQQTKLFYYVIHYKVGIYQRFARHVFLVGLTQLTHLIDIESLVWVYFQHPHHQTTQFLAVPLRQRWKFSFRYSLEKLV
jgi:hypothetical protein